MLRISIVCLFVLFSVVGANTQATAQTQELSKKELKAIQKKQQEEIKARKKYPELFEDLDVQIEELEKENARIQKQIIDLPKASVKQDIIINSNDEDVTELFDDKLEDLYESWYIQNTIDPSFFSDVRATSVKKAIDYPDSMYINRLQSISSGITLSYNETVKGVIELYTQRRPYTAESVLGLSTYYFPMIEETLDKYDLPHELKYMAIIESALKPAAKSHASALGLWQFMYRTGKMYGLQEDTYVDERCDPVKSTDAAARFLTDLYGIYGDWHLAIAAYNCGPGNVNKAIRRAGGKKDYWDIYYYLPKETRGYVPAFIAAAYFMNYYEEHGLSAKMPDFPIATDTVEINRYLNFEQLTHVIGVGKEELEALNPQYKIDIIPATAENKYSLTLPMKYIPSFIDQEDSIYAYKREEYFPDNKIKQPKGANVSSSRTIAGKDRLEYTVRSGDVIGKISEKFHVRTSSIRGWNNLRGNLIRVGQKLTIYVPAGSGSKYASYSGTRLMSSSSSRTSSTKATGTVSTSNGWTYYTVRSGDNLWAIARKFPGISAQNIKDANNMKSDKINIGQKLKIKKN